MTVAEFIRRARRAGWTVSIAGSGHLRYEHPDAARPVVGPRTPSCPRALKNTEAALRRALPQEPKVPKPERAVPKPKRRSPAPKPSPKPTIDIDQAIELYRPSELPSRRPIPGAPRGYVTTDWRI